MLGTEERVQLWIWFLVFGWFSAYSWYWYVRSIIFYFKNGFDFSEDFGPKMNEFDDDDRYSAKPREKLLAAWPLFAVLSSSAALFLGLTLMGIIKPVIIVGP